MFFSVITFQVSADVSRARSHWLNSQRLSLDREETEVDSGMNCYWVSSSQQLSWRYDCSSHAEFNPRKEHPLKLLTWRFLGH